MGAVFDIAEELSPALRVLCGRERTVLGDEKPALALTKTSAISNKILVEAGGIEPPSEDLPIPATTRLVRGF
jgi:hypothetical protein